MKNFYTPISLYFLFYIIVFLCTPVISTAQTTTLTTPIINDYYKVTAIDPCTGNITLNNTINLSVGNRVLIIQMKGATINTANTISFGEIQTYGNAGNYEFGNVATISGNIVTLTNGISRAYNPADLVQLVRVPQYTNVIVDVDITAKAWDGNTGGVLAFEATGTVTLNEDIDVEGKGFRGGVAFDHVPCTWGGQNIYACAAGGTCGARKGEGIVLANSNFELGRAPYANGGGGGNDNNSGGGGGSNAGAGGIGGERYSTFFNCPGPFPGMGGKPITVYSNGDNKIFLGGGGGAGDMNNTALASGGNGGGIIIIKANTIIGNDNKIEADGIDAAISVADGAGGGGGAGSILLDVQTFTTIVRVEAEGGYGGIADGINQTNNCNGPGGGGGGGLIWYTGASFPANVQTKVDGGDKGTMINGTGNCPTGTSSGAADGALGNILYNLVIQESSGGSSSGPIANAGADVSICTGGSVTLNGSGGVTYAWTPAGSLSNPNIANPVATPTSTTTYILTVTDANGCTDTDDVIVTVTTGLTVNAGADVAICNGNSTTLSASGGVNYSWSPTTGLSNPNIANPTASPTTTTTYIVTVTDGSGCSGTDDVVVTVNIPAPVNAGADVSICNGNFTTLSATGSGSFNWSPTTGLSNPNIQNPVASPAATTTYIVTVTDANGCTTSDNVMVTVYNLPAVNAGSDITICSGNSTTLSASGTGTFSWSPAAGLSNPNIQNPIASPTATTTYTVTLTNANGCTATDDVMVSVNTAANASIAAPATSICAGGSVILTASGGTIYSWSPATGLSNPNIAAPTASPPTTTTYTVTVNNAANCPDTETITITVNPLPIANAGTNVSICNGGSIGLSASGGQSYSWLPSSSLSNPNINNPIASPGVTTIYTVTVTDNNGCSNTDDVQVTVLPGINALAWPDTAVCSGNAVQLNATGGSSYVWAPAAGLTNPNIANPVATPASTTTYTVTVSSGSCSPVVRTVTITINPAPVTTVRSDTSICAGRSVAMSASGGVTYSWSPATGLSNPNIANPIATPATTTTYSVTITNSGGCSKVEDVLITVNNSPVITTNNDTTICSGESVQMFATGGNTYSWTPAVGLSNPNINNPVATPALTTTYTVNVTNGAGCTGSKIVNLTVNSIPVAVASTNLSTICVGDSAQFDVTSAATNFSWSPVTGLSNPNIKYPKASPAATTVYTVTVSDNAGCFETDIITLTVNPKPTTNAGPDKTICTGGSTTLNGNATGTYSWSPSTGLSNPNILNPTASPAVTTTYTLTATSAAGCVNKDSTIVTVGNSVTADAGANATICSGSSTQLNAQGGTVYLWSPVTGLSNPNISNPMATPATTTTYTVTVSDGSNCSDTDVVTVTVTPGIVATVNAPGSICIGDTAQLVASGGTNYLWTPATGLSNAAIANPKAYPAVTTTYTVTVSSGSCTPNSATLTVTVNPLPIVTASNDTTICNGTSAQLNVNTGTSFSWTPAGSLSSSNIKNPLASPVTTTTYTVEVTDANGCKASDSVKVTVGPPLNISASATPDTICSGETTNLSASGGISYNWSPASSISNPNISNPTATPVGSTVYTVTVTDATGCAATAAVPVIVHALPNLMVMADDTVCTGGSIQLNASGTGTNYQWSPAASLSDPDIPNPIASPSVTTNYTVSVIDMYGCSNMDSVLITVIPALNTSINADTVICAGESLVLNATGGDTYEWNPAAGLSNTSVATPIAIPSATTTYSVIISKGNCEPDTLNVTVTVNPLPVVDAGQDTAIFAGNPVQLNADILNGLNATYQWTPSIYLNNAAIKAPIAIVFSNTLFEVTATTSEGCSSKDDISISIIGDEQKRVIVPNAFSPNGDGINDEINPVTSEDVTLVKFSVFDRWGNMVYESRQGNFKWNGKMNGSDLPLGAYIYMVEYVTFDGQTHIKKGNITLLK